MCKDNINFNIIDIELDLVIPLKRKRITFPSSLRGLFEIINGKCI